MYLAVLFLSISRTTLGKAMWFTDATGAEHFGIGVGTVVLALNVFFLAQLHLRLPFVAAFDRRVPG